MESKYEKKKNIYLSVGLILFALCVTGATYAYFALTASNNSITGTVGGATLRLTVTKVIPTTVTTNMIPQLESTLGDAILSNYNCVDENGNVVCQVYKATITNNGDTSAELTGTISFQYTTSSSYTVEQRLPNLKWKRITNATTLGEYNTYQALSTDQIFEENKVFAPDATQDYYFVIWIDETGEVQTDTGTFRATINFNTADGDGLTSTIKPTIASTFIQDLYNTEGDTVTMVHIGNDESKPEVLLNSTRGIMLDNNGVYRYYGKSPNNYVEFNGELWRIISVGNVKSGDSDTVGSNRIKIIRDEPIGNYSWDSSDSSINSGYGVNDWTKADLNTELNDLYYNKSSGNCYIDYNNSFTSCNFTSIGLSDESKNLFDDALWYLGGISNPSTLPTGVNDFLYPIADLYPNDYYDLERGTIVWGSIDGQICNDGACPRATNWTGKIGLMYPSDYVYSTDLSLCTKVGYSASGNDYDYRNVLCKENSWLYSTLYSQWFISSSNKSSSDVFLNAGPTALVGLDVVFGTTRTNAVRPSVYLKPNVIITGGEGTDEEPYQLSLG